MTDLDAPDTGSSPRPARALGARYRLLFGASAISNLGDGLAVIAYPWLASAVTRNPLLIAVVAVAQRLPWLLFSLPAGVVTDRHDRRTLMVGANWIRAVLTLGVAVTVLAQSDGLLGPDELDGPGGVVDTDLLLYVVILAATLLMGVAEVLYDNSAQTLMPSIVDHRQLERANGRLWSIEQAANTFVGPPLGAALLAVSFSLPFFVDAGTFALSAALITLIPRATARPARSDLSWHEEARVGFRWLWRHELLRRLAIILGLLNGLGMMTLAILVLYAQEVLGTSTTEFALLTTGGAVGAVVGGWTASRVSGAIGGGPSLWLTLIGIGVTSLVIGLTSWWPLVWAMFAVTTLLGTYWNVITVSLRQTIIPDDLLGRVNSVYRFFGWGMMPVGSIIGGLTVAATDQFASRELALRMPWLIAAGLHVVLFAYAAPRLTTARLDAARAAAASR